MGPPEAPGPRAHLSGTDGVSPQVQHVLREGEQDLCHLQGGKETVALHPAGHHVVRGSVPVRRPSGGTWPGVVSAEKLRGGDLRGRGNPWEGAAWAAGGWRA